MILNAVKSYSDGLFNLMRYDLLYCDFKDLNDDDDVDEQILISILTEWFVSVYGRARKFMLLFGNCWCFVSVFATHIEKRCAV